MLKTIKTGAHVGGGGLRLDPPFLEMKKMFNVKKIMLKFEHF